MLAHYVHLLRGGRRHSEELVEESFSVGIFTSEGEGCLRSVHLAGIRREPRFCAHILLLLHKTSLISGGTDHFPFPVLGIQFPTAQVPKTT